MEIHNHILKFSIMHDLISARTTSNPKDFKK